MNSRAAGSRPDELVFLLVCEDKMPAVPRHAAESHDRNRANRIVTVVEQDIRPIHEVRVEIRRRDFMSRAVDIVVLEQSAPDGLFDAEPDYHAVHGGDAGRFVAPSESPMSEVNLDPERQKLPPEDPDLLALRDGVGRDECAFDLLAGLFFVAFLRLENIVHEPFGQCRELDVLIPPSRGVGDPDVPADQIMRSLDIPPGDVVEDSDPFGAREHPVNVGVLLGRHHHRAAERRIAKYVMQPLRWNELAPVYVQGVSVSDVG